MRNLRVSKPSRRHRNRRGTAALEVLASIAVVGLPSAVLFVLAVVGCRNLYHIITSIVGSPFL